jgi:DEAD/DEAH box helicase domain-containing protein
LGSKTLFAQKKRGECMNRIVLDLETQKTFEEVGGRHMHLLRVSVVGVYHYLKDKYMIFEEREVPALEEILKSVDLIVGFNVKRFDFLVLEPYLSIPVRKLPALDIMEEITRVTGHRVSLDSVAQATLGVRKSGSGLEAVSLFREGRIEALKRYCLDDVRITRKLYEYGQRHGELSFVSRRGWNQYSIPVSWTTKNEKKV